MEILKHEQKPVIITDLMDISVFKIAMHKELVIIYIKYQIIKNRCEIYIICNQKTTTRTRKIY